jgi:phage gp46-like protein
MLTITSPEKKYQNQDRLFMPRRVREDVADKMSYLKFGSRLHTINKLKQVQKVMTEGYELNDNELEYKVVAENIKRLRSTFDEEQVK